MTAQQHDPTTPTEPAEPADVAVVAALAPADPQTPGLNPDPLLDVHQAGDYLGTGARFIRRLIAERRITVTRIGGHVRVRRSVLETYIADSTVPAERGGAGA